MKYSEPCLMWSQLMLSVAYCDSIFLSFFLSNLFLYFFYLVKVDVYGTNHIFLCRVSSAILKQIWNLGFKILRPANTKLTIFNKAIFFYSKCHLMFSWLILIISYCDQILNSKIWVEPKLFEWLVTCGSIPVYINTSSITRWYNDVVTTLSRRRICSSLTN